MNLIMNTRTGFLLVLALLCGRASALGPHEVAVLVNRNSQASLEIANHFIHLRKIPPANVVILDLPPSVLEAASEMSPEDFTKHIWEPARKAIRDRRIEDHILAWVYSADFPVRITSDPPVSLQGITFVRNELPEPAQISDGLYLSPLFRGPDKQVGPAGESISFERFTPMLRQAMPLPSMMLSHTGARGLTAEESVALLKRGASSDRSAPSDGVFWVTNSDIRSRCRDWQFEAVQNELRARKVASDLVTNVPGRGRATIGLQLGQAWVDAPYAASFLPGAMAEHLTSFGALFHDPDQSKLTEWLRAGATASAGTVTEPRSIWSKFPAGRFFTHYATGCTMIESFFQSVRCPLQLLVVGEPLAKPWAEPVELTVVNLGDEDEPVKGDADFLATVWAGMDQPTPEMLFLLDGRAVPHPAGDPQLKLDTRQLTDGYHELRVIAYARQQVRHQSFATSGFEVANRGRSCAIALVDAAEEMDLARPLRFSFTVTGAPKELAIVAQERVLTKALYTVDAVLPVDPKVLGAGPVTLQGVALYPDNEPVRSPPVTVRLARLDRPPSVELSEIEPGTNGTKRIGASASDPEDDALALQWLSTIPLSEASRPDAGFVLNGVAVEPEPASTSTIARTTGPVGSLWYPWPGATHVTEIQVDLSVPAQWPELKEQVAGIVYDYRDAENFAFFGLFGDTSAWTFGRREAGTWKRGVTRGKPLRAGRWYQVALRNDKDGGVSAWVDGEFVCQTPEGTVSGSGVGLFVGPESGRFRNLRVSPPCYPAGAFAVASNQVEIVDGVAAAGHEIAAQVRDGTSSAWGAWRVPAGDQ
jgi:uncharacterized protein (TIGR03790 family)